MTTHSRIITIPIKPHIKKFLLKTFRSIEPLRVDEDSLLGKHAISLLLDRRHHGQPGPNYNDQLTEQLRLQLSVELSKRTPSIKKLQRLNLYFEHLFKLSLYTWVHACAECQVNPWNATRGFIEYYKFTEQEYTHMAAHRAWMRYKNNEYQRNRKSRRIASQNDQDNVTTI